MAAHAGSSTNWVFSSTLLQIYTEDRFRGRVFAAEIGLLTLTIAITGYAAGVANDWVVPVRTGIVWLDGLAMLLGMAVLAAVIGMIESAMARYRLVHVPQFIVGAATLSVVGFILILV